MCYNELLKITVSFQLIYKAYAYFVEESQKSFIQEPLIHLKPYGLWWSLIIYFRVFSKYEFVFSVSPCDSVTCQNEGTCVVEAGLAICYCRGDYSGATCAGENYIRKH